MFVGLLFLEIANETAAVLARLERERENHESREKMMRLVGEDLKSGILCSPLSRD
jgi:hypothetical protein